MSGGVLYNVTNTIGIKTYVFTLIKVADRISCIGMTMNRETAGAEPGGKRNVVCMVAKTIDFIAHALRPNAGNNNKYHSAAL